MCSGRPETSNLRSDAALYRQANTPRWVVQYEFISYCRQQHKIVSWLPKPKLIFTHHVCVWGPKGSRKNTQGMPSRPCKCGKPALKRRTNIHLRNALIVAKLGPLGAPPALAYLYASIVLVLHIGISAPT